jgi:hypothetical protein
MWSKWLNRPVRLHEAVPSAGSAPSISQHRLHLFEILAIPAALLSLGDALVTQYLVGLGRVDEGNPLMLRLLAGNQFLLFKFTGTAICLLLLWGVSKRFPRLSGATALFMMLFYCGVLIWNSSVLSSA